MTAKVIVVEDEQLISTMVRINLAKEGFDVTCFATAEEMLEYVRTTDHGCNVMLLDIMLPGMNGDVAIKELRGMGFAAPVLMLTARQDLEARVGTLDSGADDYLTKPFNVEELIARVNALIRRSNQAVDGQKDE